MVGKQNQLALLEIEANAPGGVGQHQGGDAQPAKNAHREGDFFRGVSLVRVDAALHHGDGSSSDGTEDQASAMAFDRGAGKVGYVAVRDGDGVLDAVGERTQPGAEHNGHALA